MNTMFNEKFLEVIAHEGVASIVTSGEDGPHASNTWNSYLTLVEGNRILMPAAAMIVTEKNSNFCSKVKMTVGSHEVMGYRYMGTGFLLEGTLKFIKSGEEFNMMFAKYPFLTRVAEFTVTSCKQTL